MHDKPLLLTKAVYSLLNESISPATLSIDKCASKVSMSSTSFRRKLNLEETSFKTIQQKYLNEFCVTALLTDDMSIDEIFLKLGYSERSTFERAFRQRFGVSPIQFRELSLSVTNCSSYKSLVTTAQNMPPLSDSCKQLLNEKDNENFDLERVLTIVAPDAIFTGRLIGLASKAIYGKTPRSLREAISRSLGISTVINLAIVFSAKDLLNKHIEGHIIEQCTKAFIIAPKLFQLICKSKGGAVIVDKPLIEQVLIFALLGLFLLCHRNTNKHKFAHHSLRGISDLTILNSHFLKTMGITVFGASSLMLSLWHLDADVIKQINHLDKLSKKSIKASKQDEFVLFMLACIFNLATENIDYSEINLRAKQLNVDNFDDIRRAALNL
jgi:AraC-like DNA-binding protein/HD-like signal output (HDOD) protein